MKKPAVLHLSCWVAGSLILGIALCFPLVSFMPLLWGVGLAFAFVLYFGACVVSGRKVIPVGYLVIGLVYSSFFAWSVAAFVGVERVERFECALKVGAKGIEVDLSPIGGFGWSRVESAGLTEHVEHDRPTKVWVDVPIVRDFGRVRARGVIQSIDGIRVREP